MKNRHLQINAEQTNSADKIRADVRHAFALKPDTIVFNEANAVTHAEIRSEAKRLGYAYFIPKGAASQVCLVWNAKRYRKTYQTSTFAMKGKTHVSPNRYVVRVSLVDRSTGQKVALVGTHMVSSGWTGSRSLDLWRQRGWYAHYAVLKTVLSWVYRHFDVVIWSGDMNRPPYTFSRGQTFTALRFKGAKTAGTVKTDGTHGKTIFDYVGVLSRSHKVRTVRVSTPAFHSDHDGVLADFEW